MIFNHCSVSCVLLRFSQRLVDIMGALDDIFDIANLAVVEC